MGTYAQIDRATVETLVLASGNFNYTLPAGATRFRIEAQGAGGPGGAGRRGAAGTVRCGGGPGGTGSFIVAELTAADILAQFPTGVVPCNVGASVNGAAGQTVDNTDGANGGAVSTSVNGTWFGSPGPGPTSLVVAPTGSAGFGGTATTGTGGNNGVPSMVTVNSSTAASASTVGGAGTNGILSASGPGGGITSGNVAGNGAPGQNAALRRVVAGSAGTVDTAVPTSGVAAVRGPGAGAGGGAASITTAAQKGADGAPNSGVGGGGGGASLNGNTSGGGGNSGSGYMRIVAYFD